MLTSSHPTFCLTNKLLIGLLLFTSSCAVYMPTTPGTPLVQQGEIEITAAVRGASSLGIEAGAAWSPISHLLLTGESGLHYCVNKPNGKNYPSLHKQAGLGVGVYQVLGVSHPIYVAAVAGMGRASASVYSVELLGAPNKFEADYSKYYGQIYAALQGRRFSGGLSLRGTHLNFQHLQLDGNPVSKAASFYVEPTLFGRMGTGPWQIQSAIGLSVPNYTDPSVGNNYYINPTTFLISAGLVFKPGARKHHAELTR